MKKRLLSGLLAMLLVVESLSMQVYASEVKETTEDVTIISEDAVDATPSPSAEIMVDEEVVEASPSSTIEKIEEIVFVSPTIEPEEVKEKEAEPTATPKEMLEVEEAEIVPTETLENSMKLEDEMLLSDVPADGANITLTSGAIAEYFLGKVGTSVAQASCLAFIADSFAALGAVRSFANCAYEYGSAHITSTSMENIPVGADVFFNWNSNYKGTWYTCGNHYCHHIGVYVGDGYVVHTSGGVVKKDTISEILSWGNDFRGWGYHGNVTITSDIGDTDNHIQFWGWEYDDKSVSGCPQIWLKQLDVAPNSNVHIYVDDKLYRILSPDSSGLYSFYFNTYDFSTSSSQHTISALLIDGADSTKQYKVEKSITIDNSNDYFGFWGFDDTLIEGAPQIWLKSIGFSDNSTVLIYIDDVLYQILYPDASNLYSFYLNTYEFTTVTEREEHVLAALLIDSKNDEKRVWVKKTITMDNSNSYIGFWSVDETSFSEVSTISEKPRIFLKSNGFSANSKLYIYVDDILYHTLSPDATGFYSFELNTYLYSQGEHTLTAFLVDGEKKVEVKQKINIANERTEDVNIPIIESACIKQFDKGGYVISVTASDDIGIDSVVFITQAPDGKVVQKGGELQKDGTYVYSMKISELGNIEGVYTTNITVYDKSGNASQVKAVEKYIDCTAPIISNVEINRISDDAVKISCKVLDTSEIDRVAFPTWSNHNGQDDLEEDWYNNCKGTKEGDKWVWYVYDSQHNYEKGDYATDIYAYDAYGNRGGAGEIIYSFVNLYQSTAFNDSVK